MNPKMPALLLVLCGYETYVIPRKDLGLQVLKNVRNLF
jgi:hypothetical protein